MREAAQGRCLPGTLVDSGKDVHEAGRLWSHTTGGQFTEMSYVLMHSIDGRLLRVRMGDNVS